MRIILLISLLIGSFGLRSQGGFEIFSYYNSVDTVIDAVVFRDTEVFDNQELTGLKRGMLYKGDQIQVLPEKNQSNKWSKKHVFIKYDEDEGYILKEDLRLASSLFENGYELDYACRKVDDLWILDIDFIKENSLYASRSDTLANYQFAVSISDGRGISGVSDVVFIDYIAEACGVNGGGIYYFIDNGELHKAIEIDQISDAGTFWYSQELIFPDDEQNWNSEILLSTEKGEYLADSFTWLKSKKEIKAYQWNGRQLLPMDNNK